MRNTLLILLLNVFHIFAVNTYSQTKTLTFELNDVTIKEALTQIEEQSEFYFLYNSKLVDVTRKTDLKVKDQKIDQILSELFDNTDVNYMVFNRQIILSPREYINSLKQEAKQPSIITGTVSNQNGEPLIGVTVTVKGTTHGTITNYQGIYSLSNVPEDAVLVFSFVGMKTQEISIVGKTIINIIMDEETIGIEEVVVVGYGTQKKINVTGAISTVSAQELKTRPVTSVAEALQGLVPNLQINTTDGGTPGSPFSWQIRGIGSIGGADDRPLILIDGVESNPNYLNPDDIENVSVLKDAAASAIYGSRAPFGVILITTRKGKSGEMKVSFSSNFSSRVPTKMLNTMGSLDFMNYLNEGAANRGLAPQFDQAWIDSVQWNVDHPEIYRPYLQSPTNPNEWFRFVGVDIDWFDATYKPSSLTQNYNINASGGSKSVNYYISLGYLDQEGLFRYGNDEYKRYTGLVNLHTDAAKWLEVGMKLKMSRGLTDIPNAPALQTDVYESWPIYPIFDANGHFSRIAGIFVLQDQGGRKNTVTDMFSNMFTFVIKPFDGFKLSGDATFNLSNSIYRENQKVINQYFPDGRMDPNLTYIGAERSYITQSNASNKYYSGNVYIDYTKRFNDHDIHLLAGGQLEYNNYFSLYGHRDNLLHESILSLSAAAGNDIQLNDTQYEWATEGVFGRINYQYKEKYLLEANARYDGTSRFPKNLRWGFFPSISVGYIISKESFFESVSTVVSMMKFRVSYGRLGNSNVDYYYSPQMSKRPTKLIGINGAFVDYMTAPGLGNYDLTWEKPTTFNVAVDIGMFNNQLQTSFDWYNRKTIDMIGPSEPVPAIFGVSVPVKNNTEMKGTGWEWTLSYKGRAKDFNYQAVVNVGHHKEVVTKYYNPSGLISSYYDGKVLGEIWGFETVGFINDEQMLNSMSDQSEIYANWGLGDIMYKDQDGDDKISKGSLTLEKHGDLIRIGNTTPDFAYNFNFLCDFKGFDLRMFLTGLGHTDWWPNSGQGSANYYTSQIFFGYGNALKINEHLDRWTPDNHEAYYPRVLISDNTVALKNKQEQTKYLQNRAYIRLKNMQLGYTLPIRLTKPLLINNARIYISGENLLTFTKLRIFDPETPGLIYPLQKVYSAGISVTF